MEKLVDTHELERELRATLSAQREIGPDHDHQLVANFMSKVQQQRPAPLPAPMPMPMPVPYPIPQPQPNTAAWLRLALAILSLLFLGLAWMVVLAWMVTGAPHVGFEGLADLFLVSVAVLGINIAFNLHR